MWAWWLLRARIRNIFHASNDSGEDWELWKRYMNVTKNLYNPNSHNSSSPGTTTAVSAASLQRLWLKKKAGTNEMFLSRTCGSSPSVIWCFRGEPAGPPVRSRHAWTVEVYLTAGRDVIWPSGSMFSCLLFGSLSCCWGDKENDRWRSRQQSESDSTSLSSVSVSRKARSLRNTSSLPNSNFNQYLCILTDLSSSSPRIGVFESNALPQCFPVLWSSLHDILPILNVPHQHSADKFASSTPLLLQ